MGSKTPPCGSQSPAAIPVPAPTTAADTNNTETPPPAGRGGMHHPRPPGAPPPLPATEPDPMPVPERAAPSASHRLRLPQSVIFHAPDAHHFAHLEQARARPRPDPL